MSITFFLPKWKKSGILPQVGGVLYASVCYLSDSEASSKCQAFPYPLVAMVIVWSLASIWSALPGLRGPTLAWEASWGRSQGVPRAVTQLRLGREGGFKMAQGQG